MTEAPPQPGAASTSLPSNPPAEKDQLRELFRMQQALNHRIGVHTDGMSDEEKTRWILNYCRAMSQEIAELTDSLPWKWWAKYQKLSLIHISEPTRLLSISYAVFCLK